MDTVDAVIADVLRRLESIESSFSKMFADTQRISLEQQHIKELFSARVSSNEKALADVLTRLQVLSDSMQAMWSDSEKTPAGRSLRDAIGTVAATVDEHTTLIEKHAITHADLKQWRDRVDGVLYLLKWIGIGGLITIALSLMQFMMKAKGAL